MPIMKSPGRLRVSSSSVDDLEAPSFSGLESPSKSGMKPAAPKIWVCQVALALTQASFVIGSVYLKDKMGHIGKGEVFHPIVFVFSREATAGPLLYAIAWLSTGVALPEWQDAWRVAGLGLCLFLSQLFYIIGIELSGVVIATCMQPAIPVFTVMLGVLLKMESANLQKLAGVIFAVMGAVCMVLGGQSHSHVGSTGADDGHTMGGNACLLINTMAMATYYVLGKKLLSKYSPAQVSAWAYLVAATLMGTAATFFTTRSDWNFPHALLLPLAYWVLVCSVAGYYAVAWAMSQLPASQVASFQCLQPFLGSLLAWLVLNEELSWWDTGAVGVILGLLLVSTDRRDTQAQMELMLKMIKTRSRAALSAMALAPVKEEE